MFRSLMIVSAALVLGLVSRAALAESATEIAATEAVDGDTVDCDGDCCADESLFGMGFILPSAQGFGEFISPITNPVYFEDPRTLTEARIIFIHHQLPPALGNGDVDLIACQLRAALTERLSLVASKDGYIMASDDAPHSDGWADVALGLKYNLISDCECQRLLSAGFHYELPVGSPQALQGNGDGIFHLYLTGGTEIGDANHVLSAVGIRLPSNPHENSQSMYWSNHFDHRFGCTNLYGLFECNWYHWLNSGDNPALAGIEGLDLYNFGSTDVAGNDIVTGAIGMKYKPSDNRELGLAWEFPLTERRDIIDNRITVDLILRY